MSDLPLDGVRVLDVSTALAGPVTATLLGDFGAEVIKIEEPGRGDVVARSRIARSDVAAPGGRSLLWAQEGRNKSSVAINLRDARGQQLLRRLVPHCDVVVTNYRPPTLARWGLGPDQLPALNPRAILLYLTGYGLTGPYRERGAFDRVASAFAGLTFVSGEPGRQPVRTGYAVIDYMSAYLAAFGIMTALYHRDVRGGDGQVIDLALYEAAFRASEEAMMDFVVNGRVRRPTGNRNPTVVPATDYPTADGKYVSVHAGTGTLLAKIGRVIGVDLCADPRFATPAARVSHQDALYAVVGEWIGRHTSDEVVAAMDGEGVPSAVVMSIADIAADAHYRERGTVVTVEDPEFGSLPMAAPLPRLSTTPGRIREVGPALGQHTRGVLGDLLGIDDTALDTLHDAGVIASATPS